MLKRDLVAELVAGGMGIDAAAAAVDVVLGEIGHALEHGEDVRLSGFGTFRVKERAARAGRNPRTGEAIEIPARRAVSFSPAKALTDAMNGPQQPERRRA